MPEDAAVVRSRRARAGAPEWLAPAAAALAGALIVWITPLLLDTFAVNVLTRSMIYAVLAVTVDLLWGFTGILTFGQAAFFGVGAYATAMTMTSLGSTPAWMAGALALAIVLPMILGTHCRMAVVLPRIDAALRLGDLAGLPHCDYAAGLFGRRLDGVEQRAGGI